jgi:hypothetical protein
VQLNGRICGSVSENKLVRQQGGENQEEQFLFHKLMVSHGVKSFLLVIQVKKRGRYRPRFIPWRFNVFFKTLSRDILRVLCRFGIIEFIGFLEVGR